jgi:hypothetical protein
MKTNLLPFFAFALLAGASLHAAPLTSATAVHARPDASAPTLSLLSAGTEPTPAIGVAEALPPGWQAVELSGTHEVWAQAKDMTKSLDVKTGAELRTAPRVDAPIFTKMEPGDSAELSGTRGKWMQVKLQKKMIGYINNPAPFSPAAVASTSPTAAPSRSATPPPSPAPAAPAASSFAGSGRPAQMVNLGDGGSAALPRLFPGKFVSTRRALMPRRPYDYQLTDKGGERYAYLDVSKLLLTEQLDKYIDRELVVYGVAKPVPNTKDIVIEVESLQLR